MDTNRRPVTPPSNLPPVAAPVPALRRFVLYTLSEHDARVVNGQREVASWRKGNEAHEGDVFPMLITRVWADWQGKVHPDSLVNGQVFLDGNDTLWATSVKAGTGPNTYSWGDRT